MTNPIPAGPSAGPKYHGGDGSPSVTALRAEFEHWYVTHAFDYAANPIGTRDCDLQWRAWLGARAIDAQRPTASAPKAEGGDRISALSSFIEYRDGIAIRVDKSGGCAPATLFEKEMWAALTGAAIESLSRQGREATTCTQRNADVLAIQLREVECAPNDSYMRGLYNGMLMICCNEDKADYHPAVKTETTRASEAGDCVWTLDESEYASIWETSCGESCSFTEDGPAENNCRFCHGCGKPVSIAAAPAPGGGLE